MLEWYYDIRDPFEGQSPFYGPRVYIVLQTTTQKGKGVNVKKAKRPGRGTIKGSVWIRSNGYSVVPTTTGLAVVDPQVVNYGPHRSE